MRFRCPGCQNLFEMDALPESGRTQCPTCGQPVKVGAPQPVAGPQRPSPRRPVAPDPDFNAIPNTSFQPQTLPAYLTQPPPPRPQRARDPLRDLPDYRPHNHRARKKSGPLILISILLLGVGGTLTLACAGVVGFVMYRSGALGGATEMSIAGYSAKAPGRLAGKGSNLEDFEVAIINPWTGSQFQLIHLENEPMQRVTIDIFLERLRSTSGATTTEPVTRIGLNGIRFEAKKALGVGDSEGEVYTISNGVLVVLYTRGSSLASLKGLRVKYTGDKERQFDDVDEFFQSLTRK